MAKVAAILRGRALLTVSVLTIVPRVSNTREICPEFLSPVAVRRSYGQVRKKN